MCGIVGFVGKQQAAPLLLDGLSKLEYRGYDSAGIAVYDKEQDAIDVVKAKGRLQALRDLTGDGQSVKGCIGIGHTRWATHGEPSVVNSHPHFNKDKSVCIVHNGIIENYQPLKEKMQSRGMEFISQTDTEVVVHMLEHYYSGDPLSAIIKVMHRVKGSYALGIMFKEHPGELYAVRKDSPLIIGVSKEGNFIASDVPAILKHTRDVYFIDNLEIAKLTETSVEFFNEDAEPIEKELTTVKWDIEAAEKGGYEHFMLKEIHEQPTALKNTLTPRIIDGIPSFEECGLTDEMLRNYKNVYIVGCGSAMHAGMVGKYVIEELARTPVTVDIASEFRYRNPLITKDDLLIIISQSGETADTLAALQYGNQIGADTLAAVNVAGSHIDREAKMSMKTLAGPEISVCSTKAYMVQCAFMYMFALRLAYARGAIDFDKCKEYTDKLLAIPELIQECINRKAQYQKVASKLMNASSLLYIGRGLDYALSMEGSLKLKEISYIHSESYAGGELKHGTISLIEQDMPVIAVATQTKLFAKTAGNVEEVKSRGAKVTVVCRDSAEIHDEITDYTIRLPETDDLLMPLVAAVPLQMIAYYTALDRQCSIDKPRNLAKSVTVE